MTSKKLAELKNTLAKGQLVRIDRKSAKDDPIEGFVIGVGAEMILINSLIDFHLDGYVAILHSDVKRWKVLDGDESIAQRVLKIKGINPVPQPEIVLDSVEELLLSADREFPLISIYREAKKPDTMQVGRIDKLTEKTVSLVLLDPDATWSKPTRFNLADITRVDFDTEYNDGLWMVAGR